MSKKETPILMRGKDFLSSFELMAKAAEHKGLTLKNKGSFLSEPITTYVLDDALLAVLARNNIKRQLRPDCGDTIFTLVDGNPQEKEPGWAASNYWNFKEMPEGSRRFSLKVDLCVSFRVGVEERGVILRPYALGNFVSASDPLPNFRMFKTLFETDGKKLPSIAKDLVQNDGRIIVHWTELGFGGIRQLPALFREFTKGNIEVECLSQRRGIFSPPLDSASDIFVVEPIQYQVIQGWREQLEEYRQKLII